MTDHAAYLREYRLRKRREAGRPEDARVKCADCGKFCDWPGPYCDVCAKAQPGQPFCVISFYTRDDGRVYANLWRNRYQRRKSILRSRLMATIKLRRPLLRGEVVHHINGDVTDDRLENIEVFASQSEHARSHRSLGSDIRDRGRRCAGCGCNLDDLTRGCRTCNYRHRDRRHSGSGNRTFVPARSRCSRCGVPYDETTAGCEACQQRHRLRRKRERENG